MGVEWRDICDGVNPFNRGTWHGQLLTRDGTSTEMPTEDDVAEVVAQASTGDQWDGKVAAVLRLKDGRFVAWETFYGPTGNGFSEDAYGGEADLTFAGSLAGAIQWGLTDEGRGLLAGQLIGS